MSWATPSHMLSMLALALLAALAAALLAALIAPPTARAQTPVTVDSVEQRLVIDDSDATVPPDPEGDRGLLAVDHVLRFTVSAEIQKSAITAVSVTNPGRVRGTGPQGLDRSAGSGSIGPSTCELAPNETVVWDCVVGSHSFDLFGAPKGRYTLSVGSGTDYSITITGASATITGTDLPTATTTLTIADVVEIETVTLELAEDEPSTRAAGSTDGIDLVLKILNANNAAADPAAISTILITGAQFTLTSTAPGSSCTSSSCQWTTVRSVAQLGGRGAEAIAINVKSRTPVSGKVTVQVITAAAEVHNAESPQLTFSGAAAKLVLGAPSGTLLNEAIAGDRDEIRIQVSAQDSAGNAAELPSSLSITVRNPDGRTVAATAIAREQLAPDSGGNVYIRLRTAADSDNALAAGQYTLRVSRSSLNGERAFRVAGKASTVTVTVADPTWSSGVAQIVVNADVTDAEGQPVADGTPVTFSPGTTGAGGAQLIATRGGTIRTENGRASAQFIGVSPGRTFVTVVADGATGVEVIDVPRAPGGGGTEEPVGIGGLGEVDVNTYSSWLSSTSTRASELFDELPARGIDAIFKHDRAANRFVPYAERSGRPLPGAVDFTIELGDILWLSG